MRSLLFLLLTQLFAWPVAAQGRLEGPGALFPVQDLAGRPGVANVVEQALVKALAERTELVDAEVLRNAQRRLRLRDPAAAPPASLERLAEASGADWLLAVTLHRASESEVSRATRAFAGPSATSNWAPRVPQITLAASLYQAGKDEAGNDTVVLAWAGFAAASGLDQRRVLGLGIIDDSEELARQAATRLLDGVLTTSASAKPAPGHPSRTGFRRAAGPVAIGPVAIGPVAVVPFRGIVERDATRAAATVADLALAVLFAEEVEVLSPGIVRDVLRREEVEVRGEVRRDVRAALAKAGARTILTGTVESWAIQGSVEPNPHVALGARLVDAKTGAILWIDGVDRQGSDFEAAFGTGGIHARGALAQSLMNSLIRGMLNDKNETGDGP